MKITTDILGIIIILTPIVMFIIIMVVLKNRLKDQKVNLSHFLEETEVARKQLEKTTDDSNKTVENMPIKKSASRLILLLSGITSLILAVCITTYYFYINIFSTVCRGNIDLIDFVKVILALGIGVVPYAINQIKRIRL